MTRFPLAAISMTLGLCAPMTAWANTLDCVIKPKALVDISAGSDGKITEVLVGRGDSVAIGTHLVQLDDTLERLQQELSQARAMDQTEIKSQETRMKFRLKELERADQLSSRNVTSITTKEDAEIEVELTALSVDEAKLASRLAQIEARQADAQLERRKVTSPLDGVVTKVETSVGEYATEQTVLMTLAEIDPLYVEVFAPLDLLAAFQTGDVHVVSLAAPLTGRHDGKVTVIDKVLDAASGTFGVRLEIPNPDGLIPAGVRCTLPTPTN